MDSTVSSRFKTVFLICSLFFLGACNKDDDSEQLVIPIISDFSPASGEIGVEVTVNGKNFNATASGNVVKFNEVRATVNKATETQLVVTVPEGAATGKISVSVNGEVAKSSTDFTVLYSPKIINISADSGYVGDEIIIEGENFEATIDDNEVLFNETAATVTSATTTTLTVLVPEGATSGTIKVTVNGMTTTSSGKFTVNQPPSIIDFSPKGAIVGEEVIIQGEHFSPVASDNEVSFNGVAATVISASETTLVVVVPEEAGTGKILVKVNSKEVMSSEVFSVLSVKQIEAGGYHTLMVKSDNSLWVFGWNFYGQLGIGGQYQALEAVKIMSDVKEVAAGQNHSLILKTDNSLWGTGRNTSGELGNGSQENQIVPIQIMADVKAIAAGQAHSLILKLDNTLWSTGSNYQGQLGNGSSGNVSLIPRQVMSNVKAIAAGDGHSLILKEDGTLWVMGYNGNGQLGDGTFTNATIPKMIMTGVKAISAGDRHSLIITENNILWGMGNNQYGQVGTSTLENVNLPKQIMTGVAAVSAGYKYSFILDQEQVLWGLGSNEQGLFHLGVSNFFNTSPVRIMTGVRSISAGNYHSMVYKNDNILLVAGNNNFGQFGDGSTNPSSTSIMVPIPQ